MTKVLGITGGIGSGKSTVCRVLHHYCVPIYDSDSRAKALYDSDAELREAMTQLIGSRLYATAEGKLDRAYLAELIFADASLLGQVNALVHPAVRRDVDRWREEQSHRGYRLLGLESAILLSSEGLLERVDYTLAVVAPRELRIERAMARDGQTREAIARRVDVQMSDEEMAKRCDFVLYNDGVRHILPQLEHILGAIALDAHHL